MINSSLFLDKSIKNFFSIPRSFSENFLTSIVVNCRESIEALEYLCFLHHGNICRGCSLCLWPASVLFKWFFLTLRFITPHLRQTVSSSIVFLSRLRQEASLKSGFSLRMVLKTREAQEPVGSMMTACSNFVSLTWWSTISTTLFSRALSPSAKTLWSTSTREKFFRLRIDGVLSRKKREDSSMPSSASAATCPREYHKVWWNKIRKTLIQLLEKCIMIPTNSVLSGKSRQGMLSSGMIFWEQFGQGPICQLQRSACLVLRGCPVKGETQRGNAWIEVARLISCSATSRFSNY